MKPFSAKFVIISAISYTLDTWNVIADIVDNTGVFYAVDAQIGDIVYCKGTSLKKFSITEISAVSGARFLGKLASLDTIPVAPSITDTASIGAVVNGMYTMPDGTVQGIDATFITAVKAVENTNLLQAIGATLYVYGEEVLFDIDTNKAQTAYPAIPKSVALYLRGQRLTMGIDYRILSGQIEQLSQVDSTDTYTVDYTRSDVL